MNNCIDQYGNIFLFLKWKVWRKIFYLLSILYTYKYIHINLCYICSTLDTRVRTGDTGNESYNLYHVLIEDKLHIMHGKPVTWNKNTLTYGCVYFTYDYIVIRTVTLLGLGIPNITSATISVSEKQRSVLKTFQTLNLTFNISLVMLTILPQIYIVNNGRYTSCYMYAKDLFAWIKCNF